MIARILRAAILIAFLFSARSAFAACHTVSPSGSGSKTGADWNNAYAGLPANLTRGDIYYLADGNYQPYSFSTATSGSLTLEVRKAQSYDNCTSTGWNTSTMGSAQAVFVFGSSEPIIGINTSYITINGNGTSTGSGCGGAPGTSFTAEPPTPSDCGIRIDNTGCTSSAANACASPVYSEGAYTNYTFEYVELVGNGNNASDTQEVFAPYGGAGPSTFTHIYARNAGCVYFQYNGNYRTVSHSYFWGTEVNGAAGSSPCHGQAEFYAPPDSNYTNFGNVYRDITGTSIWTLANPGAGTSNNFVFYDDVIWNSSSYVPSNGNTLTLGTNTNGMVACINASVVCTNFLFYQNTIVNKGYSAGVDLCDTAGGCSMTVENNIWYLTTGTGGASPPTFFGNATFTQQNNSFLSSGSGCPSGTGDECVASSPDPFTNWQASNFTLASENADWDTRVSLSAPFTTDSAGNTFTTDRGAYEFSGSVAAAPQPPTGLQAVVQ